MAWAADHPQEMLAMGRNAHACYLRRYTPEVNLAELMAIYAGVIRTR
jgi:hypothetical protein